MTLVALQRLLADGHVRSFLGMVERRRGEVRRGVTPRAECELRVVMVVAVAGDAARREAHVRARGLRVTLLAEDLTVLAGQGHRVFEPTGRPALRVVAVLTRAAIDVRRAVAVGT